jgi:CRISPR/Cas system-associated exonuclease Cas4 (RecB family)
MAHSYSSWSTYTKCPALYKYQYLDRIGKKTTSPQMERGTAIHQSVEDYILKKADKLHPEIHVNWGEYVYRLMITSRCEPEVKWAFDKRWNRVEFDDPNAYIRGVLDLKWENPIDAGIKEWKTGKVYDDHVFQRNLYGLVGLELLPEYSTISVEGVYFDQNKKKQPPPEEFRRKDLKMMRTLWKDRLNLIERDKTFAPNPNYGCKYCQFAKEAGGPCRFG